MDMLKKLLLLSSFEKNYFRDSLFILIFNCYHWIYESFAELTEQPSVAEESVSSFDLDQSGGGIIYLQSQAPTALQSSRTASYRPINGTNDTEHQIKQPDWSESNT